MSNISINNKSNNTVTMSRLSPLAKPFTVSKQQNSSSVLHEAESTTTTPSKSTTYHSWRYPPWDFGVSSDMAPLIDFDSDFDHHEIFQFTGSNGSASIPSKDAIGNVVPAMQSTSLPALDYEASSSASINISSNNLASKNKEGFEDKAVTNETMHQRIDHPITCEVRDPAPIKADLIDLNDESELDSPCWKGAMSRNPTFSASEPANTECVRNGRENSFTLNPSAPQFFPSSIKKTSNFSKERSIADSVQGSCFSELSSIIETPLVGEDSCTATMPLLGNGNGLSSSMHTRVCAPLDFTETHVVLNTMKELSESLVQNSSNDLRPFDDQSLEIIEHIISNLTSCMENRFQKGSNYQSSSLSLQKPIDLHKCPRPNETEKEIQQARSTNGATALDSYSMLKDQMQVIERAMREHHQVDELNPQVSLYRNLWLEAEAALCFSKYQARVLSMKTDADDAICSKGDGR